MYPVMPALLSEIPSLTLNRDRLSFGTIAQEAASVTYKILKKIICGQETEAGNEVHERSGHTLLGGFHRGCC